MTGACDTVVIEVAGRFGNGDVDFGSSLGPGLPRLLPGVEGHEDRRRGVRFMA
jgi:hypothetical protein